MRRASVVVGTALPPLGVTTLLPLTAHTRCENHLSFDSISSAVPLLMSPPKLARSDPPTTSPTPLVATALQQ
jgi:hypothetical protein